MNILEKAGLNTSVREIKRFLKSGIPIYNSELPDTASRKRRIRRTQAITKRFAFHNNAIIKSSSVRLATHGQIS